MIALFLYLGQSVVQVLSGCPSISPSITGVVVMRYLFKVGGGGSVKLATNRKEKICE